MTMPETIDAPAPVDDTGDTDSEQQQPADDDAGMANDPMAIAQLVLSSAADQMLDHKHGGTRAEKIALGQALSTFALAAAMRQQTAIMANAQALQLAQMQKARDAEQHRSPSGIVVPR